MQKHTRPTVIDIVSKPAPNGWWEATARWAYDDGENETVPGTDYATAYARGPVEAAQKAAARLESRS